jgi:hypothetical protein
MKRHVANAGKCFGCAIVIGLNCSQGWEMIILGILWGMGVSEVGAAIDAWLEEKGY